MNQLATGHITLNEGAEITPQVFPTNRDLWNQDDQQGTIFGKPAVRISLIDSLNHILLAII